MAYGGLEGAAHEGVDSSAGLERGVESPSKFAVVDKIQGVVIVFGEGVWRDGGEVQDGSVLDIVVLAGFCGMTLEGLDLEGELEEGLDGTVLA